MILTVWPTAQQPPLYRKRKASGLKTLMTCLATSISDGGSTSWSRTIPAPDTTGYAEVVEEGSGTNKKYEVNYPNGESVWTSEAINVSAYDTVDVSIYLSSESRDGDFFESDDYLQVYYVIDGGAETLWPGGSFVGSVAADTAGAGSNQTTLDP